jgi:hypothetical protein
LIDDWIQSLGGWRAETLAEVRRMIRGADPDIVEECKWAKASNPQGVPVWSHDGIICTGEAYKQVVKLTFARGASLGDPRGLFNSGLGGSTRRAIDIREGEKLNVRAFQALIKQAVALNASTARERRAAIPGKAKVRDHRTAASPRPAGKPGASENRPAAARKGARDVVLLSGGNPQIPKGDGNAPLRAYIAAMPGWKKDIGRRLDALIVRTVPRVRKAVKWNSPFYGIEGQGWFLSFHVFTRYVKVTFFAGASLRPVPPGSTLRSGDARWLDIYEEGFDEAQLASWVKQAAAMPGWIP